MGQKCSLGKQIWHVTAILLQHYHHLHCISAQLKYELSEVGINIDDQCCAGIAATGQKCLLGKQILHVRAILVQHYHQLHFISGELECKLSEVGINFDDQCCVP